jgi:hypothetical protein
MRKKLGIALVLTVLSVAFVPAFAEDATTVTGEPVDIACHLGGKSGEGHIACATACAAKGSPIGISVKDADGKETLYLAMASGGKQAKDLLGTMMGKQVKATGVVTEKGGMKVLTIASVEAAK